MNIIRALLCLGVALAAIVESSYASQLELDIAYVETQKGLQIKGRTNAPDGTKLGISVSGNGYKAQDFDVFVRSGEFASTSFTNSGQTLAGDFTASVIIYPNSMWQKDTKVLSQLKTLIGKPAGEQKIDKSIVMSLGTAAQKHEASQLVASESARVESLAAKAIELLNKGRSMDPLRSRAKAQQCGEMMRKLQPQAQAFRSQVNQLPNSSEKVFLGAAGPGLELCVSCSESLAMSNCDDAESYLRDGGLL